MLLQWSAHFNGEIFKGLLNFTLLLIQLTSKLFSVKCLELIMKPQTEYAFEIL